MGTFSIEHAKTDVALDRIAALANEIWHEHFVPIIGLEQVNYMVGKFQSYPALKDQVKDGYEYYQIFSDGVFAGYMGIHPEENSVFLSKLYLHKDYRGQGLASQAASFLEEMCRKRGWEKIWLTCNKNNENTLAVYRHLGFENVRSEVTDIGNGFVMDDYILELTVD